MNELKPCPFCGGESRLHEHPPVCSITGYWVECSNGGCPVGPVSHAFDSRQDAIDAWNNRPDITPNGNIRWKADIRYRGKVLSKKDQPVLQFTEDGDFVAWYPSRNAAAEAMYVSKTTIGYACNGKHKTCGGHVLANDTPDMWWNWEETDQSSSEATP